MQPDTIQRLTGIDVARALAVIGMLMMHVGPRNADGFGGMLYDIPHGRASILFVFLAGVGAALATARPQSRKKGQLRLVWVALVFLPLGLVLQALDHGVAVILHHYAAFYALALLILPLRSATIFGLASVATLAGPAAYLAIRNFSPELANRAPVEAGAGGGEIFVNLLVSGPYPLLTWAGILMWGIWVGRMPLQSLATQKFLILAGVALVTLGIFASQIGLSVWGEPADRLDWRNLLLATAHSQMPFWLIGALGSAMLVTGAMLFAARHLPKAFAPLVTFGQLALSFYVAHLVVLHFYVDTLRHDDLMGAMGSVILLVGLGLGFAVIWRRYFAKGPIERLMALPFKATRRLKPHERNEPIFD